MVEADIQTTRITPTIEDYVKAIYTLQQQGDDVTTSLLGAQLGGLKPGTVTGMLKKLADLHFVTYTPYHGVRLTQAGQQVALEIVRHHRLLELYLVRALGYSWDEVHEEAEILEHYISEKFEARIAAQLGDPDFDPHGDPIPTLDGSLPDRNDAVLADLPVGARAQIVRVRDQHAERLRYLQSLGLVPGAPIEVVAVAPFDGPISVRVGDTVHPLDRRVTRKIFVAPAARDEAPGQSA